MTGKKIKIKEVYVRWVGIVVLAYIMTFIHGREPGETVMEKYLTAFTFTVIYWNGAFFLFMYFRRLFPEIRQTPKRLMITVVALAVFMTVADPILCTLFNFNKDHDVFSLAYLMPNLGINLTAAAVVGSVYENVYFFDQWKTSIKVNEELKNQQIRTQFEVLQNQMSPHFLFNSLNTLTALIGEDQATAMQFTEKLSEVYRYILQHKEMELVSLEWELEFARNYAYLLQMRYPENLTIDFAVGEEYMHAQVAPLTLQMLVENAIKHNVISKAHPLRIAVYVEKEASIIVKNNLQKKGSIGKSTKTGLQNIQKRYAYFGKDDVDIIVTSKHFMVAIPLIYLTKENESVAV